MDSLDFFKKERGVETPPLGNESSAMCLRIVAANVAKIMKKQIILKYNAL
jgi:hypothetical protein